MPTRFPGFAKRQLVLIETDVDGAIVAWRAIVDAVQTGRLVVAVHDDPVPRELREGAAVSITTVTSTSVFTVDGAVTRRSDSTLALALRDDHAPMQRRQFVRVAARPVVRCLLLDDRANEFTPFDAYVHDIGGGGMALEADVIAPRERQERHEEYLLHVGFSAISERDRERLVRFVFTCMREDRGTVVRRR